jgi:hypothetical protein
MFAVIFTIVGLGLTYTIIRDVFGEIIKNSENPALKIFKKKG